ncbi:MAG TPA: hypothetical protein VFM18_02640 [Methanosarcina sp.]|nr:hypothetical protein [Methanosarcina sp.]
MIGNSNERLFGGINKIIAEQYAKMKEGTSVSDTDQKALGDKEQLDEVGCRKKMEESQDYKVFMKKDDWDSRVGNLHLNPSQNGKDHVEAKDEHGNVQGWWNGHTGVGYLHKDCCDHALSETNQLGNVEEGTQVSESITEFKEGDPVKIKSDFSDKYSKSFSSGIHKFSMNVMKKDGVPYSQILQNGKKGFEVDIPTKEIEHHSVAEEMQNEKPQEDTLNNFVSSNTPMAEDAAIPDVKIPDGKLDLNHSGVCEEMGTVFGKRKFEVSYMSPDGSMKVHTHEKFSPRGIYRSYKDLENEKGIKLVDITHNGHSVMDDASKQDNYEPQEHIDEEVIQETHMTPELQKKQEDYVMKLKKNEDSFKDKYGDNWEGVMYATATKLAKNDLGIKEETIEESQNDPLQKDSVGDAIVTDQPIKN